MHASANLFKEAQGAPHCTRRPLWKRVVRHGQGSAISLMFWWGGTSGEGSVVHALMMYRRSPKSAALDGLLPHGGMLCMTCIA